jgi:hypothetical protein
MKKKYVITDERFEKAKQLIRSNGGSVGNHSFTIRGVKGIFQKKGAVLVINITDKPFLASWAMIENKLNDFFKA